MSAQATLAVVGVSHHAAPLEVRERFVLGGSELEQAHAALLDLPDIREAVLLSTCNRTEAYVAGGGEAVESVQRHLAERAGLGERGAAYLYVHRGRAAAEHLFRVAAGLDSMIVGEAQIQGQVRGAYELAQRSASVGPVLSRMCERALSVGALVRTETGLGKGAGSIATAVLEIARKVFGELRGRRAVVVGAGEISELVLQMLRAQGAEATIVASRGEERAAALAERLQIGTARFEQLGGLLDEAEILVSATAAPHAVIRRPLVEGALARRREPLLIFDLAVPRDVEQSVAELDVFLYAIDDLRQVVERREAWWQQEVQRAESLVQLAVDEFQAWYRSRSAVPLIRALREQAEAVRDAEVQRLFRRYPRLSEGERAAIERLAAQLTAKILHGPMVRLRDAAMRDDEQAIALLEAARFLFQLDTAEGNEDWTDESGVA